MAAIGKMNQLKVVRHAPQGAYLEGGSLGQVLLPARYVPQGCEPGDEVEVFLYFDSEDRVVATTEKPLAMAGEFALLEVLAVTPHGAFLNWGLPKDLFVPFKEQSPPMIAGERYVVFVYTDGYNGRPLASARVDRFLHNTEGEFKAGQEVDVMVAKNTELGYKCIVNNTRTGMIYHSDAYQPLQPGQLLKAYIGQVREDGRLDLLLQQPGYGKVLSLRDLILDDLSRNNGFLPLGDKTPAETIQARFGVSKKTFKQAIGALYRERLITLEAEGIRLLKK